jgi:hypothetical protein
MQALHRRAAGPGRCPSVTRGLSSARGVRVQSVFNKGAVGREWIDTILSRFGPVTDKAQNITTLDFEKPLLELDKRIREVGVMLCHHLPITCLRGCCGVPLGLLPLLTVGAVALHRSARWPRRTAWTSAHRLRSWRSGRSRCGGAHPDTRARAPTAATARRAVWGARQRARARGRARMPVACRMQHIVAACTPPAAHTRVLQAYRPNSSAVPAGGWSWLVVPCCCGDTLRGCVPHVPAGCRVCAARLQLRKETYSRLTPTQRLQVARHPNRPTCLDIILNITGGLRLRCRAGLLCAVCPAPPAAAPHSRCACLTATPPLSPSVCVRPGVLQYTHTHSR